MRSELNLISSFKNENGAIDLASIMVGIIVIGMIGGVIAATVFAVIPWAQDNAAKQQLDSVASAESAYKGLSSTNPPSLPAGLAANSYGSSAELDTAGLLKTGPKYCADKTSDAQSWNAYSQSGSGKIWTSSDKATKPVIFTGNLPTDCQFITEGTAATPTPPATPPTGNLTLTTLTYQCDFDTTGKFPIYDKVTGTETWDDGLVVNYTNTLQTDDRTLLAGVPYKVTFDGTYEVLHANEFTGCLTSVEEWGADTGVLSAEAAFAGAVKLTSVPSIIPTTIQNMGYLFQGATSFNSSNVSDWDVSNVRYMQSMFDSSGFNQSLNNWDVSNVENFSDMFLGTPFNQPLNNWNTSSAKSMQYMFANARDFNQNLDTWNVSNVATMEAMFHSAVSFNQPINSWNTASLVNMQQTFANAFTFNQPLGSWNTSNVTNMAETFSLAGNFNQDINSWDVSNVTGMYAMFANTPNFNQPLGNWNTVNVVDMSAMFLNSESFNQDINSWNVSNVVDMNHMFNNAMVFNKPLNSWNVGKVANLSEMFNSNPDFVQDLSMWNTASVVQSNNFALSTFPVTFLPPGVNPS